jgi:hypothetical protein
MNKSVCYMYRQPFPFRSESAQTKYEISLPATLAFTRYKVGYLNLQVKQILLDLFISLVLQKFGPNAEFELFCEKNPP